MSVQVAKLDGGRLHLQHGPIDLIISAEGEQRQIDLACARAIEIFPEILPELVRELEALRQPVGSSLPSVTGPVARRMARAVHPYHAVFVTPMAAVAGSVADHVLAAMMGVAELSKAVVNDGGDIAFHLGHGAAFRSGIVGDVAAPALDATIEIASHHPVRGLATSGWRGRSQSLGIADAVTVLARTAAEADVAATMIANAVNVDHSAIRRLPACEVKDDSDLGDLLVTVDVGPLPAQAIEEALEAGLQAARDFISRGLVAAAYLQLQGRRCSIGGENWARRAIASAA